MRAVITGGRDFNDAECVNRTLDYWKPSEIAHGAQIGADSLAEAWAINNNVPSSKDKYYVTKEEWRRVGKKAGPLRNKRMLEEFKPDVVIAFPGGDGTANCVRQAKKMGIRVIYVSRCW